LFNLPIFLFLNKIEFFFSKPKTTSEPTLYAKSLAFLLEMFKIPKQGFIAGTRVEEGIIHRGAKARLIRDDEVIHEGSVTSLKRFKDDVKEIKEGMECGIGIEGAGKFKEDDIIVTFEIQSIKRTLEL